MSAEAVLKCYRKACFRFSYFTIKSAKKKPKPNGNCPVLTVR